MEHGAAAGPSEGIGDSLDKKARFADGDFLDLEPASAGKGMRILGQFFLGCRSLVLGLPEEVESSCGSVDDRCAVATAAPWHSELVYLQGTSDISVTRPRPCSAWRSRWSGLTCARCLPSP